MDAPGLDTEGSLALSFAAGHPIGRQFSVVETALFNFGYVKSLAVPTSDDEIAILAGLQWRPSVVEDACVTVLAGVGIHSTVRYTQAGASEETVVGPSAGVELAWLPLKRTEFAAGFALHVRASRFEHETVASSALLLVVRLRLSKAR